MQNFEFLYVKLVFGDSQKTFGKIYLSVRCDVKLFKRKGVCIFTKGAEPETQAKDDFRDFDERMGYL